jgi:uncharacterized protein (TIGR02284 family)
MALSTVEIRSELNNLKEVCKDGEVGFREAADKLTRIDLKSLFLDFSSQRARFATQFESQISKLGGEPSDGGTVGAFFHRRLLDLKTMAGHDHDAAVISEAERGEDAAKKAYQEALTKDLPADLHDMVQEQYRTVLDTHNKVRALELQQTA